MKLTDKAILRMVSESPGRNTSEPIGGPDKKIDPRGRVWCLRCLLLVMCTHPFAKKAFTLHLSRSEGHERYFGCNLTLIAKSSKHENAKQPHWAQARSSCWGTPSPPL